MKKLLLTLAISAQIMIASSQSLSNAGFELWTSGSPNGWDCTNQDLSFFQIKNVNAESNAHEGTNCVVLETITAMTMSMSGIVCNGSYVAPSPMNAYKETVKGLPYTLRPVQFSYGYKATPSKNDSCFISINFSKNGAIIGSAKQVIKNSVTDWTKTTLDINWVNSSNPDTMTILLKSSYNTSTGAVAGSKLWVDDLKLIEETIHLKTIQNKNIEIYPIPFNDELNILATSTIQKISVYNALGKEVITNQQLNENAKLNTSFLRSGIYFIKILVNNEEIVIKSMKE